MFLLLFSKVVCFCLFSLEFVRLYIQHLRQTKQKQNNKIITTTKQTQLREKQSNNKYSSSSRNLKDIHSRSSGGLEDVLYLCCLLFSNVCCFSVVVSFCVCLVFLSFCMYERTTTIVNTKQTNNLRAKNKQTKYSSSSRNLTDIYSRPSGGLDVLYVCLCSFSMLFFVFLLFFCFFVFA